MKTEKKQYAEAEGLFTWPADEPHLIGGLCKGCNTYFFPKFSEFHKPGCPQGPVEEVLLSTRGKLASYTVQYFPVPSPFVNADPFVPFAIGLVALPEGIEVIGQLTGVSIEDVKTGTDVELVVEKLCEDKDGNEAMTWKFRPV